MSSQQLTKQIAVLFLGVSICAVVPAMSQDHDHEAKPAGPTSQPAMHVSLEREMGAMGRAYRIIRKQVGDKSKNASTLAAVQDLEQHTLASKSVAPRSATTLPSASENAQKLGDYDTQMIALLRRELDLEEQLRANDNDAAAKTVAALHDLEGQGHRDFRMKRED